MGTQTVTVLFTDLVGSTDLLSRVGERSADELRREHFALLRAEVEAHGGREVKNLGDGLMVVFDGVTAALDAAVGMQQALSARPVSAERLEIRVGVSVGEAEHEDGDFFGLPVIEAARLCARAEGGEILTTGFVQMLARSRSDVVLDRVGELELKGLDEPVETYRVGWEPLPSGVGLWGHELPARLAAGVASNFVGRDVEHGELVAGWKAVIEGTTPRIAFVGGEPGIGKSTLAARLASEINDEGGLVFYGHCDEDLGIPYQPWVEALTQLVAAAPEELLAAHVEDHGAHLARLVPDLARRVGVSVPPAGDGDAERFVLFGCVIDLLERAGSDAPVLVVLDDLHWVDRPSVQLLRHVMVTDRPVRVGVLATFRDSEVGTDHPVSELFAALHRQGDMVRINLQGLTDVDVLDLLERIAGHEMDDTGVALRDAVLAETNGNPFFVVEILRHLAESGTIYQRDDGRWVADADLQTVGLPVSVREVIGRRIAALGAEAERVLTYAAVIGRDFDTTLLAAVTELDEDAAIDVCDAATDAAVLDETETVGRYTFSHALIEHTLYKGLSATRRARAHRAVAEQLEELTHGEPGERVAELAYHWSQAVQPSDASKAVHYAQLAGDRALEQFAPDEAVRWYRQALELEGNGTSLSGVQRIEVLLGLGVAQRQVGDIAYRETLLDTARIADEHDDVELLVKAALANTRGWSSVIGGEDSERIAVIDRALERLGPSPSGDRARLLALAAIERTYTRPLAERSALAEEAVAAARASGDTAALAATLRFSSEAILHTSTLEQRTTWLQEACQLTDRLDSPAIAFWVHNSSMNAALERADGDAIDRHWQRMNEIRSRVPDESMRWNAEFYEAWRRGLRGDLDGYGRLSEVALQTGTQSGQPDAFDLYCAQLVDLRIHQGRLHEMIPLIEQAIIDMPGLPVYLAALAGAKARAGDHEPVKALIAEAAANGFVMPENTQWTAGLCSWAIAAAQSGAIEHIPQLRAILAPYHDHLATTAATFEPAIAHYLGLLDHASGDYDLAEQCFEEALALQQRVGSPILVATTQAAYAAVLADRGRGDDHDRARTMAQAALDAANPGGWGYVEADARAVLERLD